MFLEVAKIYQLYRASLTSQYSDDLGATLVWTLLPEQFSAIHHAAKARDLFYEVSREPVNYVRILYMAYGEGLGLAI